MTDTAAVEAALEQAVLTLYKLPFAPDAPLPGAPDRAWSPGLIIRDAWSRNSAGRTHPVPPPTPAAVIALALALAWLADLTDDQAEVLWLRAGHERWATLAQRLRVQRPRCWAIWKDGVVAIARRVERERKAEARASASPTTAPTTSGGGGHA